MVRQNAADAGLHCASQEIINWGGQLLIDSAWDPRVFLTLETRMEHGYQQWCAAEAAEVPGRAA